MSDSLLCLIGNFILYVFALLLFLKNAKCFTGASLILCYYLFSALCSILFYAHPYTAQTYYYREICWQALLYFFVLSIILIYPVFCFDKKCQNKVVLIREKPIIIYMYIMLAIQVILIMGYLPAFVVMATSDMATMRDSIGGGDVSPNQYVIKVFAQIMFRYENFKLLSTIIAVYAFFFVQKKRRLVLSYTFVSLVFPMYTSFLYLMRSQMFLQIIFVGYFLFLFRNFLTKKQKKMIFVFSAIIVSTIMLVLVTISQGRFDDLASWMYYKYSGETFVNFAGQLWNDAKGTTDGYAYFRWLIDGSDWKGLFEKWEFIEHKVGIHAQIFYGAIGQLVIEFGWILSAAIHIAFGIFSYYIVNNKKYISLSNIVLVGFIVYYVLYGFYIFPFQGTAMNQVIIILIAYFYSKSQRITRTVKI